MIPVRYTRYITLPALLLLQGFCAAAQHVVFMANAGASKMGLNDQIEVSYTIRDAKDLQTIGPGKLKDFVIVAGPFTERSSSTNVTGNGVVQTMTASVTYILQPRHTGKLTIPAGVAKDAAGNTYQSNTLAIQVVPGSLAQQQRRQQASQYDPWSDDPFAGRDPFAALRQRMMQGQTERRQAPPARTCDLNKEIFIKVDVDKPSVHLGEQVTASYKLYTRLPMQAGISRLPSLNGFWTQDFEISRQPKPTEEIINGRKYQVFLLKKSALFPQQTGKLILDPAEVEGTARILQQGQQGNAFAEILDDPLYRQAMGGSFSMSDPLFNDDFFSSMPYRDIPVHLKSIPVTVNVLPLPEKNVPGNYGGAVGDFTIQATLGKTAITTDDAATFTFSVNGTGNLKLIGAPKLQLPAGLDTYEPRIADTVTGRGTTISGSKIFSYSIAARKPGNYRIPAIPFTYFSTQRNQYITLHSQPFTLQVRPGKNEAPAIAAKVRPALKDIHENVLKVPASFAPAAVKPLILTPGYWSLYALPLLALIGVSVWKRREDELRGNPLLLKNKRANKIAMTRLAIAKSQLQSSSQKPFYEEISKAIWLYLSDKLNIPLAALSKEVAMNMLTARNVPAALQSSVAHVTEDCELALYAPPGGQQQMQQTYDEAIDIISRLEEHLQQSIT